MKDNIEFNVFSDFFVTLPTTDGSKIHRNNNGDYYTTPVKTYPVVSTAIIIYELSNEPIQQGCWCFDLRPDEDGDLNPVIYQVLDLETELRTSTEKRIKSCTDKKLIKSGVHEMPKVIINFFVKTNGFTKMK